MIKIVIKWGFFFRSNPNIGQSTLPGTVGNEVVDDGKSTYVKLKKRTIENLNISSLENESGVI